MTTAVSSSTRANPVFWLMLLLPAAAVCASFVTLAIALRDADRALPQAYHWEGAGLDADFARLRAAAAHATEMRLELRDGQCIAHVVRAPDGAATLELRLTNAADARRDRVLELKRVAPGQYRAPCEPPAAGRWRVAVEDGARRWAIRAQVAGTLDGLTLPARHPDGPTS
jgi:uncharacterized protein